MVVSILETAHMPIMRTVSLLEAAQDAPREIREGLRAALDGIAREIEKEAKRYFDGIEEYIAETETILKMEQNNV